VKVTYHSEEFAAAINVAMIEHRENPDDGGSKHFEKVAQTSGRLHVHLQEAEGL
jgi:hypothetical protein